MMRLWRCRDDKANKIAAAGIERGRQREVIEKRPARQCPELIRASVSCPAETARSGVGDAEMSLQGGAIIQQRGAVGGVDHGAALEDDRVVGDTQNLFRVLLDQDRRTCLRRG